jgi:heterodisulfide reductase subunit B
MRYLYYPGCCCALKATGKAYEESLLAVFKALEVPLEELPDWNCCGATAYMSIDEMKAFALAARNLALAQREAETHMLEEAHLVAPCSACFLVLTKAQRYLEEYPAVSERITKALEAAGLRYTNTVRVRHPLDVLVNDIGLEAIRERVKRPLEGLKVACYYGCQTVRPYGFDDLTNPTTMDRLVEALGAEAVDWPLKARCCGGTHMGTIEEVGMRLSYILLNEAHKRGADVMATACPLCECNLECFQRQILKRYGDIGELPAVFFTQLVGLALGLSERELGLQRLLVPLRPVIEAKVAVGG